MRIVYVFTTDSIRIAAFVAYFWQFEIDFAGSASLDFAVFMSSVASTVSEALNIAFRKWVWCIRLNTNRTIAN